MAPAIPDEPFRFFACTYCGADCRCPERLVQAYARQNVTRWCESCGRLFHIKMPPRGDAG
jgi:hypothetical protein